MSLFDREAVKKRIRERGGLGSVLSDAVIDEIFNEIEWALPRMLEHAKTDLIELAGFRLVEVAEQRLKDEREGKPEPEAAQVQMRRLVYVNGGSQSPVQPLVQAWTRAGAENLMSSPSWIDAMIPEYNLEVCARVAIDQGWVRGLDDTGPTRYRAPR